LEPERVGLTYWSDGFSYRGSSKFPRIDANGMLYKVNHNDVYLANEYHPEVNVLQYESAILGRYYPDLSICECFHSRHIFHPFGIVAYAMIE
jgi:hypothetical protein